MLGSLSLFGRRPVDIAPPVVMVTDVNSTGGIVHVTVAVGNCIKIYAIPDDWIVSNDGKKCLITNPKTGQTMDIRLHYNMEVLTGPHLHCYSSEGSSKYDNINQTFTVTDKTSKTSTYPIPKGWVYVGSLGKCDAMIQRGMAVISLMDYYSVP